MNITGAIVLFASIWFLTLFIVMPIGQRSQEEMGDVVPGTPPGAPHKPAFKRKLVITTLITMALWFACFILITGGFFSRADIETWDSLIRR